MGVGGRKEEEGGGSPQWATGLVLWLVRPVD